MSFLVGSKMCLLFYRKLIFDDLGKIITYWQLLSLILLKSCKNADFLPTLLLRFNINEASENSSLV